ncbi:MAG: hypothetical protein N2C12_17135 [Planctomycetales bacterium]
MKTPLEREAQAASADNDAKIDWNRPRLKRQGQNKPLGGGTNTSANDSTAAGTSSYKTSGAS